MVRDQDAPRADPPETAAGAPSSGARSWSRFAGSLLALCFGVAGVVLSVRMGVGSLRAPQAGLWPLLVSVALCLFALVSLSGDRGEEDPETLPLPRVVLGVLSLALFVVAFEALGVVIPTLLVLVLWLRALAQETWRSTLVIAVAGTAALWVVFDVLLDVPLPAGPFGT